MASVQIPLTQGKYALVDEEDYAFLSRYHWSAVSTGGLWYAHRGDYTCGRTTVYMHREILGDPTIIQVDHRDGDGLNNCRRNLRPATATQNHGNMRRPKHNTSGFKGVSWDDPRGKWRAQIQYEGRNRFIARCTNLEDAARRYDQEARRLFGSFARTNFPA